jgi:hypothetical protein
MLGLTFCKQTSSHLLSPSVLSVTVCEELSNEDLNQYFDFSFFPDREILENAQLGHDRAAQYYGGEPKLTLDSLPSVDQIVQKNMDSWYKMPPFTDPFGLDIGRVQEGIYDSPYVTKDTNSSFKSQMKYSAWRKDNYYQDTAFSSPQIQSSLSPKLLLRGGDKFDAISGRSTELTTTSSHAAKALKSKSDFPPSLLDPRNVRLSTASTLESEILARI